MRAGVVDTRVIGKPDQFDGDSMKYAGWSFKLRSYEPWISSIGKS